MGKPDGWLVGQTYGRTWIPDGYVSVQRDDDAGIFDGDLAAAKAYADSRGGGVVLCIASNEATETLAPESDVLVHITGQPTVVRWMHMSLAAASGLYAPVCED